ncbi:uncharacterized protein LOC109595322 isoform X2 [Aethina tumida]|uniref:uncharacterized protein LOC109595322 isoform X2 n=1 Tax=Aethina tumida TaxID=116153 RepID=UPI002147EEBF|nr:uncharacterized protein LOC109595322 isoform X2 [Aethina tumida]
MNDELLLTQIRNAIVGAIEEAQNEIRAQMERLIGEAEYLMETGAAQIEELFHTAQYELHNFTETTSKDISNCVKEKEKDIMSVKKEMLTQFEECISIGIQELHRTADEFQANFQRVLRSVSSDSLKVFPPSREQTIDKVDSDEQIPEEPLPTSLLDIPKKLAQNVVRTMKELTVIMGDLENCIAPIVQLSTKRIKWILDELKFCVETNEEPIND